MGANHSKTSRRAIARLRSVEDDAATAMTTMQVDGRCHCGAISYEATLDPERLSVCHCTDCQTLGSSAFRLSVPVPAGDFRLLSGTPKIYIKTAESGNRRAQAFCADCGTPIYASAADQPKVFSLRVGSMRQRAALRPSRQIWCRSALPWVTDLPRIARTDKE
jgi:hypothetical protein